ncbi:MAG: hypothetical protein ABS80_18050 [Pseudonocardia sp. SCN 72-51]|nr:MAG: hypothetical protein ABS80_18050 [Pseudonocardia sp. SCN 72-51]
MEVIYLDPPSVGNPCLGQRHPDGGAIRYSHVGIGSFDGVHVGHHEVLRGCDTVLTFDPHPLRVLDPGRAPRLLGDRSVKLRKLAELGIRRVAFIPFDVRWSQVSPEQFVEHVLLDGLQAAAVSVGENFRFGAGGAGTPRMLEEHPMLRSRIVPVVSRDGDVVSSTRIRALVAAGDVAGAASLLTEPLVMPAVVDKNGRLIVDEAYALPAAGRYLGEVSGRSVVVDIRDDGTVYAVDGWCPGEVVYVSFLRRAESPT